MPILFVAQELFPDPFSHSLKTIVGVSFLTLIFEAVGLSFLGIAVYRKIRYFKHSACQLGLYSESGAPGKPLRAVLSVPRSWVKHVTGIKCKLICMKREFRMVGSKYRWTDVPIWHRTRTVGIPEEAPSEGSGTVDVPVAFEVPNDCPETEEAFLCPTFWTLEVSTDLPGIDYFGSFPIEMRKAGAGDSDVSVETVVPEESGPRPPGLADLGYERTEDGFRFRSPFLNGSLKDMLLTGVGLFFAVPGFLVTLQNPENAPRFTTILFGSLFIGLGGVLLYKGGYNLFQTLDVRVEGGTCMIRRNWLGWEEKERFPVDDIEGVDVTWSGTLLNVTYHGLTISRSDGKEHAFDALTTSKDVANFLKDQF